MDSITVVKDQLLPHFSHEHPLSLVYLQQPNHKNQNSDGEDENEEQDDSVEEVRHGGKCGMCREQIWYFYRCDVCFYKIDSICATVSEQKIKHPSHPHQLERMFGHIASICVACGQNYREDEHPNLLHCPLQDEGDSLLKHHVSNQTGKQHDGEILSHSCHQHPLILYDNHTSVGKKLVSLHDPMKRVQLLCDGCVKPIMAVPFYMCCKYADEQCSFVLHEWCANLSSQIQHYFDHPEHPLVLLPKIPSKFFGVFHCKVCNLQSNGFAFGCTECDYYVDINCAFIPNEIKHEAHPGHLLLKVKPSTGRPCKACHFWGNYWGFECPTCHFYIDVKCALLLSREIKHKLDKHPLMLRYEPAENHIEEYFCEVCEDEFNPWFWFYHCNTCAQSMHTNCAPLILQSQCEQATYGCYYERGVYYYLNMKFGGKIEIKDHPHPLSFVPGIHSDGFCIDSALWVQPYCNLNISCVSSQFT
ncbi:hypothetical protein M8C21_009893 [Ambrosia artemisiifolia]|uniref:DC1 domain-containing protein n=1 Tax=Ambrosia artemisiifolia TaxID=4212 RepID=A0AAD5GYV2_AMBAR|nr:hypothetical protein M8C21_009893 [Ambrosia artemisiifolia]